MSRKLCGLLAVLSSLLFAPAAFADDVKKDWLMGSSDVNASNYNDKENKLSPRNVKDLEVDWTFDQADAGHPVGPVHATTVVDSNKVYVGDLTGYFYAIDEDGSLLWQVETQAPDPLMAALVGTPRTPIYGAGAISAKKRYVIFGDANGRIYARDRKSGEAVWTTDVNDHPLGGVAGNSIVIAGDKVIVGIASIENFALLLQSRGVPVQCCTHRGAVVALDIDTGEVLWRHDTIDASEAGPLPAALAPFQIGPSGADIWGQPTYDDATDTVYVGTGQNFSPTAAGRSSAEADSIIALDARTGAVKWSTQFTADDVWVTGIPNPTPAGKFSDQDFGDSPKVYKLPNGRRVVAAGQKSGDYRIADARTGEIVSSSAVMGQVNSYGGLQTGGALNENTVFQHGLDRIGPVGSTDYNGRVTALTLKGATKWTFDLHLAPLLGGLAVANDVVYFMSPVSEASGAAKEWSFFALDARSGAQLRKISFPGRALSSPAVSRGSVYLGYGNRALPEVGVDLNGGVIRFGLPRK